MKRDDVTRVFFESQRRDVLNALTRAELVERVRSLARDDVSEHEIARITRLHVDQVRTMLAEVTKNNCKTDLTVFTSDKPQSAETAPENIPNRFGKFSP
jgi:hypothetical protein